MHASAASVHARSLKLLRVIELVLRLTAGWI